MKRPNGLTRTSGLALCDLRHDPVPIVSCAIGSALAHVE